MGRGRAMTGILSLVALSIGSAPVGAAGAKPSPSLVGTWNLIVKCKQPNALHQVVCATAVWAISIGGVSKKIDPDCSANVYCLTTPNTSGPGTFYGKGSLTPNGAGSWIETCVGCTGSGTITGHFKGDTFRGTTTNTSNPVSFDVTMTKTSGPAEVEIDGLVVGSDGRPYVNLEAHASNPYDASGSSAKVDAEGRFVLHTTPGTILVTLVSTEEECFGSSVAKDSVNATNGNASVRFTVPTQLFVTPVSHTDISVCAVGLPLAERSFTVELQRDSPINTGTCTEMASTVLDVIGTIYRSGSVHFLHPPVDDRFCSGPYTVTLTDKGKSGVEWAKQPVTVP